MNREILAKVDNDPQGIDLSDFDDYENGTINRTPDGIFDMVIMAFRFHFAGWDGTSRLDGETTDIASTDFGSLHVGGLDINGGFFTGSGVITEALDSKTFPILAAHEYAHRILAAGHYDYVGQFGLMDGNDGSESMCAYERELAGWISPQVINSDQTDLTLSEAITTADIYKIEIPNDEYFLIENRQRTFWADMLQGDGDCDLELPGTGLMIAHIDPDNSKPNQLWWERADNGSPTSIGTGNETDPFKPGNKIQFTPWTRPNSDTRIGTYSGIAVTNIREPGNDIIVDIDLSFTSGNITEDSWWEGTETITGLTILSSGKTLTVEAGTLISIIAGTGATLKMYGTLNVNGTQTQPVIFDRNGSSGNWIGIRFKGTSSGQINWATIRNANKAVWIDDAHNVTVSNCTIEDFLNQGVYLNGSSATIQNCTITGGIDASHGIYSIGANANPTIVNDTIRLVDIGIERQGSPGPATIADNDISAGVSGIYLESSEPEIYNNYVHNCYYGIRLGPSIASDIHNNDFYENKTGVYLEQSQPYRLRKNNFGWSGGYMRNNYYQGVLINYLETGNDFLNNRVNNFYDGWESWDIKNLTSVTIMAKRNYWDNPDIEIYGPHNANFPLAEHNENAGVQGGTGKISAPNQISKSPLSRQFQLSQNYPNPFSPLVRGNLGTSSSSSIRITLPTKAAVKLAIYDARGSLIRELANQQIYERGEAELVWNGTNTAGRPVSSGIYFYRLEARDLEGDESFSQTRKLLLVR